MEHVTTMFLNIPSETKPYIIMGTRQHNFYAVFLCSYSSKISVLQMRLNIFLCFTHTGTNLQNAESLTKMSRSPDVSSHWPQQNLRTPVAGKIRSFADKIEQLKNNFQLHRRAAVVGLRCKSEAGV